MLLNNSSDNFLSRRGGPDGDSTTEQRKTPIEASFRDRVPFRRPPQRPQKRQALSLRTKATLWALVLGTLPVMVVGSAAYVLANRAVRHEIRTTQKTQAVQVADQLNRFMLERYSDVESLAQFPGLMISQSPPPSAPSKTTAPIAKAGTAIENGSENAAATPQAILEQFKRTSKFYEGVVLFDLKGNVIAQTENYEVTNPRSQPYFEAVLKTNRPAISDLTPIPTSGNQATAKPAGSTGDPLVIYLAAPIQDRTTGKPIAIVRTQLSINALTDIAQRWGEGGDEYYVGDRAGSIFLSNRRQASTQPSIPTPLNEPWSQSIAQSFGLRPTQRPTAIAKTPRLGELPDLGWSVTFTGNVHTMLKAQRNLQLFIASSTLLTALLISAIAVTLASFATRPLRDAAEAVEELGNGKFNTRLKVTGEDELALLGTSINTMASQLEAAIASQSKAAESAEALNLIASNMRQSLTEREVLNTTVSDVRQALKTDRVLVYKFKTDWCGVIVAESVIPGAPKLLGEEVTDPMREGFIERYRNGRVRAMNDIYEEDLTQCHEDLLQTLGIRASITAPILKQGKLVGLLCAHECQSPRNWDRADIELFRQVASQLGFALDQAHLFQKQIRNAQSAEVLNLIVGRMRQSLTESDVMNNTVQEIRQAFHTDRVIIYRFKNDWCGTIVAEAVANGFRRTLGEEVTDPMREGLIERYRDGRVRAMDDIYAEGLTDCHRELLEGFQIRSSITAPVLIHGKLIGLLCIHHCSGPRQWEPEDIDLFRQVAMQLGFTLDQANLLEKQTLNASRSQLISDAVAAMRRTLDEHQIMQLAAEKALTTLRADRVVVHVFSQDFKSGTIEAEAVVPGFGKILNRRIHDPLLPECLEKFQQGGYSVINNIDQEQIAPCHRDILKSIQVQANLVVPMLSDGTLIGLLAAHQCSNAREWEEQDILLLRQLGMQLGFALDQSKLIQDQQRSAARWKVFTETIVQLRKSLDFNTILQAGAEQALTFLKVDRVVVHLFDEGFQSGKIAAESVIPGFMKILNRRIDDPLLPSCLQKFHDGGYSYLEDVAQAEIADCHRNILQSIQVQANIVVPIVRNGELLGLLAAHQCRSPRSWDAEEIELFRQIAVQIGFALDQSFLLSYTEKAREEARAEADAIAQEQRTAREFLQKRAMELLIEVDPVSRGDLTIRATVTPDEVGTIADSYNSIIESLRQIVSQVKTATTTVSQTTAENAIAVEDLSKESIEQSQAIADAIQEMQTLIHSMQGVVLRAQQAEKGVAVATQAIESGDEAMNQTVEGISMIRETVAVTSKKVKSLGEASQRISKVVSLISDFAAQTNLLALNAAIEAARAGEEGRGFGVVAEEVRALAQQSTVATAEIEQLVQEIQAQTHEVVLAMDAGTEQVVAGTQLVEDSRTKLTQIGEVSHQINQLVKEISVAAAAQTKASTKVNRTMEQVAEIATQASQRSQQVAASFDQLIEVADDLQVSVSKFKV